MTDVLKFPQDRIVRSPSAEEEPETRPHPDLVMLDVRRQSRREHLRVLMLQSRDKALTYGALAAFALGTGGAGFLASPVKSAFTIGIGVVCLVLASLTARVSRLAYLEYCQQLGDYKRVKGSVAYPQGFRRQIFLKRA